MNTYSNTHTTGTHLATAAARQLAADQQSASLVADEYSAADRAEEHGAYQGRLISSVDKVDHALQLPPILACRGRDAAMQLCSQRGCQCVCDSRICYAMKGNGRQPRVKARRAARLEFWRQDPSGWIRQLIREATPLTRLRLSGAGDFADPEMIDAIGEVAVSTPNCLYWAPTKVWLLGELWTSKLRRLQQLANVNVLLSLPGVDDLPADWAGMLCPGMTVARVYDKTPPIGHVCPAVINHSSCKQECCSACLDKTTRVVNYALHSKRC